VRPHLKDCDVAIFMFSVTDAESFRSAAFRLNEFEASVGGKRPILIIANKSDAKKTKVEENEVLAFMKKRHLEAYVKTEALSRSVDDAIAALYYLSTKKKSATHKKTLLKISRGYSKDWQAQQEKYELAQTYPNDAAALADLVSSGLGLEEDFQSFEKVAQAALESLGLEALQETVLETLKRCALVGNLKVAKVEDESAGGLLLVSREHENLNFLKKKKKKKNIEPILKRKTAEDEEHLLRAEAEDAKRALRVKAKALIRENLEKDAEEAKNVALKAIQDQKDRQLHQKAQARARNKLEQARVNGLLPLLAKKGYDGLDAFAIAADARKAAKTARRLAHQASTEALEARFTALEAQVSGVTWPDVVVHFYPGNNNRSLHNKKKKNRETPSFGISLRISLTWTWSDRPLSDLVKFVCRHINHHQHGKKKKLRPDNHHFETLLVKDLDASTPIQDALDTARGCLLLR